MERWVFWTLIFGSIILVFSGTFSVLYWVPLKSLTADITEAEYNMLADAQMNQAVNYWTAEENEANVKYVKAWRNQGMDWNNILNSPAGNAVLAAVKYYVYDHYGCWCLMNPLTSKNSPTEDYVMWDGSKWIFVPTYCGANTDKYASEAATSADLIYRARRILPNIISSPTRALDFTTI